VRTIAHPNSPLKKPPGEGTGPTTHADSRGKTVSSRGEQDVFEWAVKRSTLLGMPWLDTALDYLRRADWRSAASDRAARLSCAPSERMQETARPGARTALSARSGVEAENGRESSIRRANKVQTALSARIGRRARGQGCPRSVLESARPPYRHAKWAERRSPYVFSVVAAENWSAAFTPLPRQVRTRFTTSAELAEDQRKSRL